MKGYRWLRTAARFMLLTFLFAQILPAAYAQTDGVAADLEPPTIEHDPTLLAPALAGQPYTLNVVVTDESGVKEVVLHYRIAAEEQFRAINMQHRGANRYQAIVPPSDLVVPQMNYYIQAADNNGNAVFRGAQFSPLALQVLPGGAALGDESVADANSQAPAETGITRSADKSVAAVPTNWKWIVGGLVIVGALLAGGGGGGGDGAGGPSGPAQPQGTIVIRAPSP